MLQMFVYELLKVAFILAFWFLAGLWELSLIGLLEACTSLGSPDHNGFCPNLISIGMNFYSVLLLSLSSLVT